MKATREGLVGQRTASGYVIDRVVRFVALPSTAALHRFVRVTNPLTQQATLAQVLDVGPFNEHDDTYVFQTATAPGTGDWALPTRPAAESGLSVSGHGTNKAGIDLGEAVWVALGMTDNTLVSWEFVV